MRSLFTQKSLGIGMLAMTLSLASTIGLQANEPVYRKVAPSTAVIMRAGGHGTGWVIDGPNRLLVTAGHVVRTDDGYLAQVDVTLAQVKDDHVVTDWNHYLKNKAQLTVKGTVVYYNAQRDIALIQLPNLAIGVKPLVLAKELPRPGQDVHVVGNSSLDDGAAFAYCFGKVRNNFRYDPPGDPIRADVVSHHTPTNKGDSGGPVVNNDGEVVGFISHGTTGNPVPPGRPFHAVQVTDFSINAVEIRKSLEDWKTKHVANAAN